MTRCRLYIYMLLFLAITINNAFSQTAIVVKGKIMSQDGVPLTGASVRQKDGTAAATTDKQGFFSLNVPGGAILVVTHVGFEPKEFSAAENVQITLFPQAVKVFVEPKLLRNRNE